MPLVEQALFSNLLQAPPYRLDIAVIISDIGFVHVYPEGQAVGHLLPLLLILPDRLFALLNEGLDAKGLNLILAVKAQFLLHLQLHRQPVGVPAADAKDILALHHLVAGNQILHGPGDHVPDVGLAVGSWRPLVKGEFLLALIMGQGFCHDIVLFPKPGDVLLPGNEIHVCGNFVIHVLPPNKKSRPFGTDDRGTTQVGAMRPLRACNGGHRGGLGHAPG